MSKRRSSDPQKEDRSRTTSKNEYRMRGTEDLRRRNARVDSLRQYILSYWPREGSEPPPKYWCPFFKAYYPSSDMVVAYIVPERIGEKHFGTLFGVPELFSWNNTMFMHRDIEKHYSNGNFVIVPTIPRPDDGQAIQEWSNQPNKSYSIRVFNTAEMDRRMFYGPLTDAQAEAFRGFPNPIRFLDLNNTTIYLPSKDPQVRYLFYRFCLELSRSVKEHRQLLDWARWNLPGQFLKRDWVLGFVTHTRCQDLLIGAVPERFLRESLDYDFAWGVGMDALYDDDDSDGDWGVEADEHMSSDSDATLEP